MAPSQSAALSIPTTTRRTRSTRSARQSAVEGFFGLLGILVDRFGWPAVVLCGGAWFTNQNATIEQKRKIIDRYVLGEGIAPWWPLIVIAIVCVLVVWAQDWKHRHEVSVMRERLNEVAAQKNRLQELLAHRKLRHADELHMEGEE